MYNNKIRLEIVRGHVRAAAPEATTRTKKKEKSVLILKTQRPRVYRYCDIPRAILTAAVFPTDEIYSFATAESFARDDRDVWDPVSRKT